MVFGDAKSQLGLFAKSRVHTNLECLNASNFSAYCSLVGWGFFCFVVVVVGGFLIFCGVSGGFFGGVLREGFVCFLIQRNVTMFDPFFYFTRIFPFSILLSQYCILVSINC